jgi:molybdopterin-guanine dinucleotide biosynthesis protein B
VDLVLLEGFRLTLYPKLEIVTPVRDRRPLALDDPTVVAVTAVESPALRTSFIPLSDTPALTRLVLAKAEMVDERMSRFQASQQASTLVA